MKTKGPKYAGLALNLPDKLTAGTTKRVADYYAACEEFDTALSELNDRFQVLHEQAASLTVGVIAETGEELRKAKAALRTQLVELRWRRRELLPELIGDFEKAIVAAQRDYDGVFSAEVKRYASQGVDAGAMPAGNSPSGEIQLHARIKQELPVLAADRKLRDAKKALELLQGSLLVVPGWRSFNIPWPAVAGNHTQAISAIGNLADPPPRNPDILGYQGVAEELGFAGTILPERYQQVFNRLVELVGGRTVARKVWYTIEETNDRNQALDLLHKLPMTGLIKELLQLDKQTTPTKPRKAPRTKLQLT